jgi:hypothetical protein
MSTCGDLLIGQLEFYWDVHLRPRLDGLTDEEYLWEPAQPSWTVPRHIPSDLPGTADAGLAFLDHWYGRWHDAIRALDDDGLMRPLGPDGGPFADDSMLALITHINREVMHHGAEICLLRDLYRAGTVAK